MLDPRLLTLIGSLTDLAERPGAARKLAHTLGAEDLILFSRDPVLNLLLPAPGFPQTLPEGAKWRDFISQCVEHRRRVTQLVSPYQMKQVQVTGIAAADGSVLALLGGAPDMIQAVEVSILVPLLAAALFNERVMVVAKGQVQAETEAAEKARALAATLDVTRRELESALQRGKGILESITDAFFVLDRHWQFMELNPQAEALLKRARGQLIGQSIWLELSEAAGSVFETKFRSALADQKSVFFETFYPPLDSWFEVRAYPYRDGLAVYFLDASERKRAAEALRESQEWFRTTLHSIGDGVIAVNVDLTVTFLNPVAEALTGWKLSDAKGRLMAEVFNIIHEKTRAPAVNPVERVLREGVIVGLANHTSLIRKDGVELVIEDSAAPIKNEEGRVTGAVLVFRDATEKSRAQEELRRTLTELEVQREVRDKFVATLTHDLRNPLAAARISAQMLLKLSAQNEREAGFARRIMSSMDRADNMVQDLLDANRLQAGERLPLVIAECDLRATFKDTLEELTIVHGDRFDFLPGAPVRGYWDQGGLRRVLENLANNAVKYGSRSSRITVSLVEHPGEVRFSVHNEGPALGEEEQRDIFRPFARSSTAEASGQKGWGIGLTLVQGIARAHGGRVSLESRAGVGTVFTVTLPKDLQDAGSRGGQDSALSDGRHGSSTPTSTR